MPLVTAIPRGMSNGNTITQFTDTTNTTSVTYTYPTSQTSLVIENSGERDIFVTVGSVTNQQIQVDKKWKYDGTFTSFDIRSDVNSQEFIATAIIAEVSLTDIVMLNDHTVTYGYDVNGNVQAVTEKDASNNVIKTVTYTYNVAGDVTTSTTVMNGKTVTTTYNYDANANITSTSNVIS